MSASGQKQTFLLASGMSESDWNVRYEAIADIAARLLDHLIGGVHKALR
jgi:hypothetical protein